MEPVFQAADTIEAHIIKGMLEAHGIPATVSGNFLTGAAGELPASGMVSVCVDKEQLESAKNLISEYEQTEIR